MMKALCCLLGPALLAAVAGAQTADDEQPAVDKSGYHLFKPTPSKYLRELTIDGPGATESPYTVDAGHFQVEMSFFTYTTYQEIFRDPDFVEAGKYRFEQWAIAPMTLKIGLLNQLDLQVYLEPYKFVYEREVIEDYELRSKRHGFGDTTVRLKYNLWGNDSGRTALAIMPFVTFPTSEGGVGRRNVEGGVILPFGVELPWDFYMGLTTRFSSMQDVLGGRGQHVEFHNSVAFSRPLFGDLEGYVEFFSAVSRERGIGWIGTFDPGLIYWLTDDIQLNAGVNIGLTRSADKWNPFVGIAWRF